MPPEQGMTVRDGFRLRGATVSRLETFVDAAFAFGVTMLVISVGSVPRTFDDLNLALRQVPVFAACFLLLAMLWWAHDLWSRRFGIESENAAVLSLLFVFVMLVWIYPLRLVFTEALSWITAGWVPSGMERGRMNAFDLQTCFRVYGVGFGALNAILLALNRMALSRRIELDLSPLELLETRRTIGVHLIHVVVACASIALTFVVERSSSGLVGSIPGWVYVLTGAAMSWHHGRYHRLRARLALG